MKQQTKPRGEDWLWKASLQGSEPCSPGHLPPTPYPSCLFPPRQGPAKGTLLALLIHSISNLDASWPLFYLHCHPPQQGC